MRMAAGVLVVVAAEEAKSRSAEQALSFALHEDGALLASFLDLVFIRRT